MRLRLWRRFSIAPGLRLNVSKRGVSASVGRRGTWLTTGPRGKRATLGLPGSGLFLTQQWRPAAPQARSTRAVLFWLAVLVALVAFGTLSRT